MARKAREKSPVGIYSIQIKSSLYPFIKEDHILFMNTLTAYEGYAILSYFLSPNLIAFVIQEKDLTLEQVMRKVMVKFVMAFKKKHDIHTEIFRERYSSAPALSLEDAYGMLGSIQALYKNHEKKKDVITAPFDFKEDPYIDHDFYIEHFSSYEDYDKKIHALNHSSRIKNRLSDEELKELLKVMYQIDPKTMNQLPKNMVMQILGGILNFAKVSARQIARVTTLPVRWLWQVTKQLTKPQWQKTEKKVKKEIQDGKKRKKPIKKEA